MRTVVKIEEWGIPDAYAKYHYPGGSLFSKQTGDKCCLGFSTLQAGITEDQADGIGFPHALLRPCIDEEPRVKPEAYPEALKCFKSPNCDSSPLAMMAAAINDNELVGWREKVSLLISLFEAHGESIQFTFRGADCGHTRGETGKQVDKFLKRKREKHARKIRKAQMAAQQEW
jgi:hypothetical protein